MKLRRVKPTMPSTLPLSFPFPGRRCTAPIAILEDIVGLQGCEEVAALARAITQNLCHREFGVVVEDRQRHPAKELERRNMPVAERLRRLRMIGLHEDRIALRKVHHEEPQLLLNAV